MKTMKNIAVAICLIGLMNGITAKNMSFETLFQEAPVASTSWSVDFNPDGPKYGNDSATCVRNLSIYREFYRQRNFTDALEPWRWVFFNCPLSSQNMYLDGAVLMKDLFNRATAAQDKEKYLDTLMMIYDQRIQAFGREGFVLGRKGVDMYYMSNVRTEAAYNTLKKSIEIERNATKPDVVVAFFQAAVKLAETESYTKEVAIDAYIAISEIIDYNLASGTDTNFNAAKTNADLIFAPIATCPDLISIYTPKYQANPSNKELLERITMMLNRYQCNDNELFFKATESLHALEPTANSAFLMGNMNLSKRQHSKASEYLQEAVRLFREDENDKKADALLMLAELHFRQLNQLVRARSFALQALEARPGDGRGLILIGDMYASSAASCGENELEKRVAYWAAVDKYIRAKAIDNSSSVESAANQRINAWSQHFPDSETIFFHGLTIGQPYTVGCWINENTSVRSK